MQICLLKWSKWRFSQRPMQKFLFLPDDEVAKTATSGCCHVPLAWNLRVASDNLMGWSTELGTGIWTKFPLIISQGHAAGIISQEGEPSAVRAARSTLAPFWLVTSLPGGSRIRCRCSGPLCCEEVAPTAPPSHAVCGLSGLLAARGGNALAAQPASPEVADLVLRYEKACVPQTAR